MHIYSSASSPQEISDDSEDSDDVQFISQSKASRKQRHNRRRPATTSAVPFHRGPRQQRSGLYEYQGYNVDEEKTIAANHHPNNVAELSTSNDVHPPQN
ncbi:hypothetical protein FNYG_06076 [Fusarium nygamai]|uniref:Uncharacterized protein n=1 Tax=Gibberella nygamai TaxID=42673 RepID=A0A2K0WDX5_GIBNY|nr:hypothetical protein FNYG_06076 [Fusarium nygamai]